MAWAAGLLGLISCGGGTGGVGPYVELGTGDRSFEELANGQEIEIYLVHL